MTVLNIALFVYPNISPFHFSTPHIIFNTKIQDKHLFNLKIFSLDGLPVKTEQSMILLPDGDVELIKEADIIIIPGWDDINHKPEKALIDGLQWAHNNKLRIMGLCYGTYVLAYSGLLDHKKVSTHWFAEQDFNERFPLAQLDRDSLYVEDQKIITSAGLGAAIDCCLNLIREIYDTETANQVSKVMVIPTHREGGQAQLIEQPLAKSNQTSQINLLLDFLRQNLTIQHNIDQLSERVHMTRRTFTRNFKKTTGMTLVDWLNAERIKLGCKLLETTNLPIEAITELSGFNNAVSFRKNFRKKYGMSPQEWRKSGHYCLNKKDKNNLTE